MSPYDEEHQEHQDSERKYQRQKARAVAASATAEIERDPTTLNALAATAKR